MPDTSSHCGDVAGRFGRCPASLLAGALGLALGASPAWGAHGRGAIAPSRWAGMRHLRPAAGALGRGAQVRSRKVRRLRRPTRLSWRLRPLQNFRDIARLTGAPPGRIFRSDDPRHRPFGSCDRIHRAGIRTVVKLNAGQHRIRWRSRPRWGRGPCGLRELRVSLPYGRTRGGRRVTIYNLGQRRSLSPARLRVVRYVERQVGLLLRRLARLEERDLPLLIHCSAGRDRTGIVVALLERIAGLSLAAIEADYLESDQTVGHTSVTGLRRVFRQIGPWRRFLRQVLGLRRWEIRRLRRLVLGPTGRGAAYRRLPKARASAARRAASIHPGCLPRPPQTGSSACGGADTSR